jgi:hypothetical protein
VELRGNGGENTSPTEKKETLHISTTDDNALLCLFTVVAAKLLVAHHLSITVVPAQVTHWQVTPIEADQHMPLHS